MYSMAFKEEHAKLFSWNVEISLKKAKAVCRAIRKKPLPEAKRILQGLIDGKISINGKYYTKTAKALLRLLESLEKNAIHKGLNPEELVLYVSPKKGTTIHRRRRKAQFGSRMKLTHVEMFAVKR